MNETNKIIIIHVLKIDVVKNRKINTSLLILNIENSLLYKRLVLIKVNIKNRKSIGDSSSVKSRIYIN